MKISKAMPELLQALKTALVSPEAAIIREFVVLPNQRVVFGNSKKRFILYEDQFGDLINKCGKAEENREKLKKIGSNFRIGRKVVNIR